MTSRRSPSSWVAAGGLNEQTGIAGSKQPTRAPVIGSLSALTSFRCSQDVSAGTARTL